MPKEQREYPEICLSEGQRKLKKRHEKSIMILILIVIVFVVCHAFRLGVQTYQVCIVNYKVEPRFKERIGQHSFDGSCKLARLGALLFLMIVQECLSIQVFFSPKLH